MAMADTRSEAFTKLQCKDARTESDINDGTAYCWKLEAQNQMCFRAFTAAGT